MGQYSSHLAHEKASEKSTSSHNEKLKDKDKENTAHHTSTGSIVAPNRNAGSKGNQSKLRKFHTITLLCVC